MAEGDDVRVTRCRALLRVPGHITRAALAEALDAPIPQPPSSPVVVVSERPGPGNIGVPAGVKLSPSGSITVAQRGAVIDALDIRGMVKVQADDVTIRRCRVKASDTAAGSDYPIKLAAGVKGCVVEDTELDGNGRTSLVIGFKGYTLRRVNAHGAAGDLLRADGDVTVEDSWLHGLVRVPGGHHDAIQMLKGSNVRVLRNTIDVAVRSPDGSVDPMNSCFIISAGSTGGGPVDKVLIEGNWLNGGNYSLYLGANNTGVPVTGVKVRDNEFGPDAKYGHINARGTALLERNHTATGLPVA